MAIEEGVKQGLSFLHRYGAGEIGTKTPSKETKNAVAAVETEEDK